jgi:hypothetical protein
MENHSWPPVLQFQTPITIIEHPNPSKLDTYMWHPKPGVRLEESWRHWAIWAFRERERERERELILVFYVLLLFSIFISL